MERSSDLNAHTKPFKKQFKPRRNEALTNKSVSDFESTS